MLLSTHSLEEAEILCDTIGWMKHGNFICMGNPEKLKVQFSEGYNLQISFKKPVWEGREDEVILQYENIDYSMYDKYDVNVKGLNIKESFMEVNKLHLKHKTESSVLWNNHSYNELNYYLVKFFLFAE